METQTAIPKFSALANESRLAVFRRLVQAGPEGMAAGAISEALEIAPNTLSAQLSLLSQAGLVTGDRHGRSIIYSVRFEAISDLIVYLLEDCCAGEACVASDVRGALSRMACLGSEGAC